MSCLAIDTMSEHYGARRVVGMPLSVDPLDLDDLLERLKPEFPAYRIAGMSHAQLVQEVASALRELAGPAWRSCDALERRTLAAGLIAALPAAAPPRLGRASAMAHR